MADAESSAHPTGSEALRRRLRAPGRKRILSLDGGGTRGIVTLAFLERIEAALCGADEEDCLAAHFDLIGGTSTGAIIATALALGWRVERIRAVYEAFAHQAFRRRWYRISPLVNRYDATVLETLLAEHFGRTVDGSERLLGSPDLRTGLAIVTKRVDTGSPWVLSNIPFAPYYGDRGGPNGNWRIPLRNLVRASTAAPTFFRSITIPLGTRADGGIETGLFVDGGASPYNNPAMRLLELARLGRFGLDWPPGPDQLLIVSVGTGRFRRRDKAVPLSWWQLARHPVDSLGAMLRRLPLMQAIGVLSSIVRDGETHTLRSLQSLGRSPQPVWVDSEVGDLDGALLGPEPLFSVLRYDIDIDAMLSAETVTAAEADAMSHLDAPGEMRVLWRLAAEAADRQVQPTHLWARTPATKTRPDAPDMK